MCVVRCMLQIARCLVFAGLRCLLFVVNCGLMQLVVGCLLIVVCCCVLMMFPVRCLLYDVCGLLFVGV